MIKLTVYFEDPFWVGVFEVTEKRLLQTSKIFFGSEPKEYEVYDFILKNYYNLHFGKPIGIDKTTTKKINPKRMNRLISRQLKEKSISTKAQQAMKLEQESRKIERKIKSKTQKQYEKEQRFKKKQEKKKQKKKGR